MKRKSFLGILFVSIAATLLTLVAVGDAYSQGEDIFFTYGRGPQAKTVSIEISLGSSDREKFLADPVATLRKQRIAVPESAEPQWRAVTVLLRRLANPHLPPTARRKPGRTTFANIVLERGVMPAVVVTIVGNWDADHVTSTGGVLAGSDSFLDNPVAVLRSHGVELPAADEREWSQLAAALKALQVAYADSGSTAAGRGSANLGLTATTPSTNAQRGRIVEGYSAEFYAGTRVENGPIEGTCNTGAGCDALKAACNSLSKHTFKKNNADGSLGVCIGQAFDQRNSDSGSPVPDFGLAAPRKSGDAGLRCHGVAMCTKVKRICATQGGKYSTVNDVSGACETEGEQQAAKESEAGNKELEAETHKEKSDPPQRVLVGRRPIRPDLIIRQFLFPPTNDKALRVHVFNTGLAPAGACRLILTVRKINGTAVGRETHVNVPALAAGADTWLLIDAKSILPVNIKLESTTFKLNVDGTAIVAESNESNNEMWHNL